MVSPASSSKVDLAASTTPSADHFAIHPVICKMIKANYNAMDENNKKAAGVMLAKGGDAAASPPFAKVCRNGLCNDACHVWLINKF